MNSRTAIIISTKDRPQDIANLLAALARQTVRPELIIISACDRNDIGKSNLSDTNVKVILGTPGSAIQRNRALSAVPGEFDIVVFFDDDFVPSQFWIERIQDFLAKEPAVICATGHVLHDGVLTGGLGWPDGTLMVENADRSARTSAVDNYRIIDHQYPYGCNMAFRAKKIEGLMFDERLVLYGWLEDRDFAFRAVREGRMVWTDAVWGVHLGTKGGRSSGRRFGYSQIVNPWYLMKKGTMRRLDVFKNIFRGIVGNAAGTFFRRSHVDRWGRLQGNMIAVKDILLGRWAPERAAEL